MKYLDKYLESRGYQDFYSDSGGYNSLYHNKIFTYAMWCGKKFVKPNSSYYDFFKEIFESFFSESYFKHKCSVQNRFESLMKVINHKYSNRSANFITIVYDNLKIDNICEPDQMIIENNSLHHIIHFKKDIHKFYYDEEKKFYVLEYSKSTIDEAFVDLLIHFKLDFHKQFGDVTDRGHALSVLTLIDIINY